MEVNIMRRHMLVPMCLALLFPSLMAATGCARVPETGRRRVLLISSSQEQTLGAQAYEEILADQKLSDDAEMTAMLERVGHRIAAVANQPDFDWEFKLIESPEVNAFCLPGGKIAFYTGILPIAANEAGVAAVMGHEVAHAVARHGGERLSQRLSVDLLEQLLAVGLRDSSPTVRDGALQAFGVGAAVGVVLPYSRRHEMEADHIGLLYTARAGYDPREAIPFWERMAGGAGARPPEFLSTHPGVERRIEQLRQLMPEALEAYEAAPVQYGLGESW
jgi:metalloendopeptidase OMA1, mitochondrial